MASTRPLREWTAGRVRRLARRRPTAAAAVRDRLRYLRLNLIIAAQAGLAAALAWYISRTLLNVAEPVFAPITAVGTIVSSVGQRLRRSVQLVIGVGVGIAAGDLLMTRIGTGAWQVALIVVLAVAVSLAVQGGTNVAVQAGSTAVLVATLAPVGRSLELPRFINAVVGGAVGIIVITAVLPPNPLRQVERAAEPLLLGLCGNLRAAARGLAERNVGAVQAAMDRTQGLNQEQDNVRNVLAGAREVATLAPLRRRRRRTVLRYQAGFAHIERVMGTVGGLIRRSATVVSDGEPVPRQLPEALTQLADAIGQLHRDVRARGPAVRTRERALGAVRTAGGAYAEDVGFSGQVVVAQVRTAVHDLLQATGLPWDEANRMIREAAGRRVAGTPRPQPPRP
ncbi:FUSC family protein [Rhizomonospora bruguierae]|uniref:FUSC family protein n=1 Tax=Rhizomonospora bruguierae TaxID=1581705 RepID=UPI001BCBCD32|nr:FUSC family protein [Micromonospora sp. NBRC 107566]